MNTSLRRRKGGIGRFLCLVVMIALTLTPNQSVWGLEVVRENYKLLASDGAAGFGGSVSVSGDVALVGASGAVYGFNLSDAKLYCDLNDDGVVDRSDIDLIRSYLNQPADVCPACDINPDGTISILDARRITQFCTHDGCR